MGTTVVMLEIQIEPDYGDGVDDLLEETLLDTSTYAGCQRVGIYGNLDESTSLVFHERLDTHGRYEKYKSWREEIGMSNELGAKLTGPPRIRYYNRIEV